MLLAARRAGFDAMPVQNRVSERFIICHGMQGTSKVIANYIAIR